MLKISIILATTEDRTEEVFYVPYRTLVHDDGENGCASGRILYAEDLEESTTDLVLQNLDKVLHLDEKATFFVICFMGEEELAEVLYSIIEPKVIGNPDVRLCVEDPEGDDRVVPFTRDDIIRASLIEKALDETHLQ